MSYHGRALRGLGTITPPPSLEILSAGTVMVLRLFVTGLSFTDAHQVLTTIVPAAGQCQNMNLDVRAVAVTAGQCSGLDLISCAVGLSTTALPSTNAWPALPLPQAWIVDIIETWSSASSLNPLPSSVGGSYSASDMATKMAAHPAMVSAFPGLTAATASASSPSTPSLNASLAVWGKLTDPPGAITFWQGMPVLWDHALGPVDSNGPGGPTQTMITPNAYSVVKGTAETGQQSIAWPVPLIGGDGPLVLPNPSNGGQDNASSTGLLLVAGGLVMGGVAWWLSKKVRL